MSWLTQACGGSRRTSPDKKGKGGGGYVGGCFFCLRVVASGGRTCG